MAGHDERTGRPAADSGEEAEHGAAKAGAGLLQRKQPPAALAFVVQFSEPYDAETFCGRVQHLLTADGGNFTTPETLVAILRRVLERTNAGRSEE
ncbi:MAG TPA: hypothetical protein VEL28_14730 [Candidatus Binatia bacterium]|nr:hypothetical protein [Candidatus Binatia bacterium]